MYVCMLTVLFKRSSPFEKETKINIMCHTHIHPFNGPLSGTTWVSRHQKGKTNLDFTEARDSEWQWHLGHMQVCTVLQTEAMPAPHHSVFYRPDALPAAQPTVSKHWRHNQIKKVHLRLGNQQKLIQHVKTENISPQNPSTDRLRIPQNFSTRKTRL